MIYNIIKFFLFHFCKIFIKEISDLKNIPKGGCIIAANHVSLLDPPLIGSLVGHKLNREVYTLGKTELFKSFIGRKFYESAKTIPIDKTGKDKSALNNAIECLKKGKVISIFPEGARSRNGRLQRGKTGAARLAITAKVSIVPAGVIGTYSVWPIHKKLFRIKKIVKVNFGKPMYFDKYYNKKITKKLLREITTKIMKEIANLSKQKYKP